jgi:mannose-6-phosphate isomerase-like protein (cupin superfamily)
VTVRRRNLDLLVAWLDAGRRADRQKMLAMLGPDAGWQGIRPEWRADTPDGVVDMWLERSRALADVEGFDSTADPRGATLKLRASGLAQIDDRLRHGVHIRFAIDDAGRITAISDHLSKRDAAPILAEETPRGIPEAALENGAPTGEGWFVVNLADSRWLTGRFGAYTVIEGRTRWPQVGVNVGVLEPGQAACFYHREADQEGFLVLKGQALLLVEGEERPLRPWDFFHSPAWTEHVLVGAGDGPCTILAVGARDDRGVVYPASEVALRHDAGVRRETTLPPEAYAGIPPDEPARFDPEWLPG